MTCVQIATTMSLDGIEISYATASAGMPKSRTLPLKLKAIANAGFQSTEIAFPDLEAHAAENFAKVAGQKYSEIGPDGRGDEEILMNASTEVKDLCDQLGLKVLTLMPYVASV